MIRLHCADGRLHCLNHEGKQLYPPAMVGQPLGFAAPIADDAGNTWICGFDGGLLHVDADGNVGSRPYFRTRQKFNSAGIIHEGTLYLGSDEGLVFAIAMERRRGKNLWDHAAGQGTTGWYIHSSPAVTEDGQVVIAGRDECLHGFQSNGRLAWKTELPGQVLGSPVIDRRGRIYVGLSIGKRGEKPHGKLLAIDGNSHNTRWEFDAAAPIESTPVIGDDDVIYFGDNAGTVYAIDAEGRESWTATVGSPVRSAGTILAPGHVAFGLDDGTLLVLHCSSDNLAETGWPKIGRTPGQYGTV